MGGGEGGRAATGSKTLIIRTPTTKL
jgi:hypothetical protein